MKPDNEVQMREWRDGDSLDVKGFLLTGYSIHYRLRGLAHTANSEMDSQRAAVYAKILQRFGMYSSGKTRASGSGSRQSSVTHGSWLTGSCRCSLTPRSIQIGGDLRGEDVFYLPLLFETIVEQLQCEQFTANDVRTEVSYLLKLRVDGRNKSMFAKHLKRTPEWKRWRLRSFRRILTHSPAFIEKAVVTMRWSSFQLNFRVVYSAMVRPARALEESEERLWSAVDAMGVPRLAMFKAMS